MCSVLLCTYGDSPIAWQTLTVFFFFFSFLRLRFLLTLFVRDDSNAVIAIPGELRRKLGQEVRGFFSLIVLKLTFLLFVISQWL